MILESKTIRMRLVEPSDAEFILRLRMDSRYNQFLSSVSPSIKAQKDWIIKYKIDERDKKQFYFIIERIDGLPCGTVRLYDFRADSFCWGSWILNEDKTRYAALESAFLVYKFGFDYLGFQKSHFDVMRGNERVQSFHEKMGALKINEDEDNFFYEITCEAIEKSRAKLVSKLD